MKFYNSLIAYALLGGLIGGLVLGVRGVVLYNKVSEEVSYNDSITKLTYGSGLERLRYNVSGLNFGPKADEIYDNEGDTLAIYSLDGKYGFINIVTGEDCISSTKHNFEHAWSFDHKSGLAAVVEDGKIGFISRDGNYQIKPQYPFNYWSLYEFECKFKNGYCLVPSGHKVKYGLIDRENMAVIPFIYDFLGDLENGYRIAELDGKYGLIDSLSNVKISPVYDDISINNFGIVLYDAEKKSQEMVAFDLKTVISKFAFDAITPLYLQESSAENEYGDIITGEPSGYSTFTLNENVGVIRNTDGRIIINAIWDDIEFFGKNVFKAELNGKYFLIDKTGKFIQ